MLWLGVAAPAWAVDLDLANGSIAIDTSASAYFQGGVGPTSYPAGEAFVITQTGGATINTISATGSVALDITLNGVNIDLTGQAPFTCAFNMVGMAVNLTLAAGSLNILTSAAECAGLHVPSASALTIDGPGELRATGGTDSAGIGSSEADTTEGAITINGGVIEARGGNNGAGIGGGRTSEGGTILITGGEIRAFGGQTGAAIGGGSRFGVTSITINGTAIVNATGGEAGATIGGGAGIGSGGQAGSGNPPASAGRIEIDTRAGARVTATGGSRIGTNHFGAAIGQGGWFSSRPGAGIAAPVSGPFPTLPTSPLTVTVGGAATFALPPVLSVGFESPVPVYAWSENNVPLVNGGDVSGADTDSLTLSNVTDTMDGNVYTLTITTQLAQSLTLGGGGDGGTITYITARALQVNALPPPPAAVPALGPAALALLALALGGVGMLRRRAV
jgi:hypothetical protein